jgi:hypothetical protein
MTYLHLYESEFEHASVWEEICQVLDIDSKATDVLLRIDRTEVIKMQDEQEHSGG